MDLAVPWACVQLDDTKEDLDRYMNYTVAERNIKTELNEGKKAIVTAILREEEGLMEKYELGYELFADMLLEVRGTALHIKVSSERLLLISTNIAYGARACVHCAADLDQPRDPL